MRHHRTPDKPFGIGLQWMGRHFTMVYSGATRSSGVGWCDGGRKGGAWRDMLGDGTGGTLELESNWPRTKRSTMQLLPTPECPSSTSFTRRFFPSASGEPSPLSADAVEDLVGALHEAPMLCGYRRGDLAADASGAPAGRFGLAPCKRASAWGDMHSCTLSRRGDVGFALPKLARRPPTGDGKAGPPGAFSPPACGVV